MDRERRLAPDRDLGADDVLDWEVHVFKARTARVVTADECCKGSPLLYVQGSEVFGPSVLEKRGLAVVQELTKGHERARRREDDLIGVG